MFRGGHKTSPAINASNLYTCPALPSIMRFIVEIIIFIGFRVVVRVGFRL